MIARLGLPEKTARLRSARLGARDMVHARMELACVTVVGLDTIAHPRIAQTVVVGMAPARCVLLSFASRLKENVLASTGILVEPVRSNHVQCQTARVTVRVKMRPAFVTAHILDWAARNVVFCRRTSPAQEIAVRMVPVSMVCAIVTTGGAALTARSRKFVPMIALSVVRVTMELAYVIHAGVGWTVELRTRRPGAK